MSGTPDDTRLLKSDLGSQLHFAQEQEPVHVLGGRPEIRENPDPVRLEGLDDARGGGSARMPFCSFKARLTAARASAVEASFGITTSKLFRKLGEAVELIMISLKTVAFGMRT